MFTSFPGTWLPFRRLFLALIAIPAIAVGIAAGRTGLAADTEALIDVRSRAAYRGPVDVAIAEDESWAVTVNELSESVSLVDLGTQQVRYELRLEGRPVSLAKLGSDELLVSCRQSGFVHRLRVSQGRLMPVAAIQVGLEPLGIATDGQRAFVGLQATGEIAELDLESNAVHRTFKVGNWPRYLTLSPDSSRLAVGLSGDSSVAVVDTASGKVLYTEPLVGGINLGQMQASKDGVHVYFPWMVYRSNPITPGNIRRGWVLANRLARIRLDGPAYREAISLDVPGRAMADVHGIALTPDEQRVTVTSSGTHELLVYRLNDLPFVGIGGPGDLIDRRLREDNDLFYRIELGGRPMGLKALADGQRLIVANHTLDRLQIVDIQRGDILHTISLGRTPADAHAVQVHRGLEIFHDAERSLDQWYSCNSCHLDGGTNAKAMDTWNDGTDLTEKTVLPLAGVVDTGPWTWHGWQKDLRASVQNSFVSTMQGDAASDEEIDAVVAYLDSLRIPPSPFRRADGSLTEQAQRGKKLFDDARFGCSNCHSGNLLTDGMVHDVGLATESDKYEGYNTPSLRGAYRKVRFLHDGRSKSLEDLLRTWHSPEAVSGGDKLTEAELSDLVAFLKSL